eukprot:6464788-Amphidinium_carterae.1
MKRVWRHQTTAEDCRRLTKALNDLMTARDRRGAEATALVVNTAKRNKKVIYFRDMSKLPSGLTSCAIIAKMRSLWKKAGDEECADFTTKMLG